MAKDDFELLTLLPTSPEDWSHRQVPPHLVYVELGINVDLHKCWTSNWPTEPQPHSVGDAPDLGVCLVQWFSLKASICLDPLWERSLQCVPTLYLQKRTRSPPKPWQQGSRFHQGGDAGGSIPEGAHQHAIVTALCGPIPFPHFPNPRKRKDTKPAQILPRTHLQTPTHFQRRPRSCAFGSMKIKHPFFNRTFYMFTKMLNSMYLFTSSCPSYFPRTWMWQYQEGGLGF